MKDRETTSASLFYPARPERSVSHAGRRTRKTDPLDTCGYDPALIARAMPRADMTIAEVVGAATHPAATSRLATGLQLPRIVASHTGDRHQRLNPVPAARDADPRNRPARGACRPSCASNANSHPQYPCDPSCLVARMLTDVLRRLGRRCVADRPPFGAGPVLWVTAATLVEVRRSNIETCHVSPNLLASVVIARSPPGG